MSEKIKNIVLSVMFFGVTVFFFLFGIITPDKDLSVSERRKLQKFPQIVFTAQP